MAPILERGRRRVERLTSELPVLPAALVALVGDELANRGVDNLGTWVRRRWDRGMRESRRTLTPLRKATTREMKKSRALRGIVPFYPAIPLVPVAVVAGLATFSAVLAIRASRRDRAIEARLDEIEAHLAAIQQEGASEHQPALPWS